MGLSVSQITDILTLVSVATPIIIGILTFSYKMWKKLHDIYIKINLISAQLTPNGGSTIKDQIDRIETRLLSLDFFQRMYLDTVDIPIFTTDGHGMCTWANRAYLSLLDKPISDVLGSGWEAAVHQDDRDRVSREWSEAISEQRPFDLEYRYKTHEDKIVLVRCKAAGGSKTGFFGIVNKIKVFPKI